MAVVEQNRVFTPAPFQIEDLKYLKEYDACANWSEMGCFKTTTGLWWATDVDSPPSKVLIITTRTGKTTYFETVPFVCPDYKLYNVTADEFPGTVKVEASRCIVLAHYHCFQNRARFVRELLAVHWDAVILDEAHRIKNRKAQWTQNIVKLKATRRHIMTGTGFVNKPDEVWQLLNFLMPNKFTSYYRFRGRYCELEKLPNKNISIVVGIREDNEAEFREVVNSVGVRRLKREVLKDLPDYYETKVMVDLNPTQRRMYNEIKKELETLDQQGELITSPSVLAQLGRLRQISTATPYVLDSRYDAKNERRVLDIELREPSSKLDALSELIESAIGSDQKFIVFSNYVDPLKLCTHRFGKSGVGYIHLSVSDRDDQRAAKVRRFQTEEVSKGGPQVFLSTIPLGGEAITLTAASTVIFLDRSWSPAANSQAIARAHRPGQKNAVQVISIEARSTVDSYVSLRLKQKHGWFKTIFST